MFRISKIDLSILIYFIIVLIPFEIRLFDANNTSVIVNFKPVLLLPFIYLFLDRKILFKKFYNENRAIVNIYLSIILYLIFNCILNGLYNKIPLMLAKYFIYVFNFYFVWYILQLYDLKKFIRYLFYISFFFTIFFILESYSNNIIYGYKDTYWFIILCITSLVYVSKYKKILNSLIFIEILSLSRTGWIALIFIYIRKISFKTFLYYILTISTISIIIVNINISQLDKYFDTIYIISKNFNELLTLSFSDFSEKSLFTNPSDNHRLFEIYRSIDIISKNYLFGVGFENYFDYSTLNYDKLGGIVRLPHNEFLRLFSEGGVVLISLSLYLYYLVYKKSKLGNIDNPFLYSSLGLFLFTSSNFMTFFFYLISYFIAKK